MFYDEDEDDGHPEMENRNVDFYRIVSHELLSLRPQLRGSLGSLHSAPTHTEDGIPIRKLYVSNLPPKTTRTELFGVFAQYGFIKSCWLRMGIKGSNKSPVPTYAFVTYSNPADAHKALEAPSHEKMLRGRNLRTMPADSWHQPAQDADGRVRWKPRSERRDDASDFDQQSTVAESISEQDDVAPEASCSESEVPEEVEEPKTDEPYTILDILNRDCLSHVLSYVPLTDLIQSERVSKRWQCMVQDYLQGIRTFKTSWWHGGALTTAVLRRLLARTGGSLARLFIDHHWTALNDRTAHTVGKFCPNLEELKIIGMHTKNWNPLIYGCKQLKFLAFVSCSKLTDSSLVQIVKNDSSVESLSVVNNSHVTGLFLTGSSPPKLNSLTFYNCYSLQGTVLCAALDTLPLLTTLRLDACPVSMWKIIPQILKKLPGLRELSLSEYMSIDFVAQQNSDFSDSLATLTELRVLNMFKNIYVTDAVLKQVAESCTKLESLNVSSCNARRNYPGVGDEGVVAVCRACHELVRLDVSYLAGLSDAGLRALPALKRLAALVARGVPALSAAPLAAALQHCHALQEVDVCGCEGVSEQVAEAARRALDAHPRALKLRLASTAVTADGLPKHKQLAIDLEDDRHNPNLRPDFFDNTFGDSSDESFDDIYELDNIDEYFRGGDNYFPPLDDDLFMEEEDFQDEYEALYAYGVNGRDIILL